MASGLSAEREAAQVARRAFADLLPRGLDTPGNLLWTVHVGAGPAVGHLWMRLAVGEDKREAYLVDIDLDVSARGRGVGRATMLAAQDEARRRGATVLRLNVFGHNVAAVRLYDGLGYAVTRSTLARRLDGSSPAAPARPVVLRDMTHEEYADLRPILVGPTTLDELLPDGPATMGHRLWTAYDGPSPVGRLWVELQHRTDRIDARIRHLDVLDAGRRRDLSRAIVVAAESACRALGAGTLLVEVVAEIDEAGGVAPAIYTDCGFELIAQTRTTSL